MLEKSYPLATINTRCKKFLVYSTNKETRKKILQSLHSSLTLLFTVLMVLLFILFFKTAFMLHFILHLSILASSFSNFVIRFFVKSGFLSVLWNVPTRHGHIHSSSQTLQRSDILNLLLSFLFPHTFSLFFLNLTLVVFCIVLFPFFTKPLLHCYKFFKFTKFNIILYSTWFANLFSIIVETRNLSFSICFSMK